jgi:hypothetical protein
LLVIKLSRSLGTIFVDEPPGSSKTAHDAEDSNFQDFLRVSRVPKRNRSENEKRNPNEEVATTKLACAHIFLFFPARVIALEGSADASAMYKRYP